MNYGDRLKLALELGGKSRKELSASMGVSVQAIGDVINGKSRALTAENNARAAAALGVNPTWLATGDGEPRTEPQPAPSPRELPPPSVAGQEVGEFVAVRRAEVKFSDGTGHVVYSEDDLSPLVFRTDFLRRMGIAQGRAVVVEAPGISNEPKIPDGAVVLVNCGDCERLNGDFFAFRVDGELLIKRLERIDGVGILATAENPNFKPKQKVYMNPPDFEVIGRAVWTGALL
ncbi:MAG: XRE family transcriptional regulator [Alcaligenaceae bacterium]|nr:MAG: XRE family transcriptional regulator [Alcaligenaceae bacterium]